MKKSGKFFILGLFLCIFASLTLFNAPGRADASPQFAIGASTHGNVNFTGRSEESFQLVCTYCHSSHGNTGNLSTILKNVIVNMSPFTLSGPVVFTARTGLNSFDDGVSASTSRICVTCHINANRPGSATAMSHSGGASHLSGDNYTGQDCTTCHPHDADGNPATIDGFMPVGGGSCMSCHKVAQGTRRQIVDSNGDGSGTGGDFKRASHHINGPTIPTDDDCKVCHDQSQHRGGVVRLYNADNVATVYALDGTGDPADYENFCISCHDGNGATRLAVPNKPFSSPGAPVTVNPTLWNASSHNISASAGSCVDCHSNGHGSNKVKLLSSVQAPWSAVSDGNADDPMKQQERFCYDCHDGSPAAVNVMAQFGLSSHHIVQTSQQSAFGIQLECSSCHNPHTNTSANKVSNPDNRTAAPVANNNTFCLACHDSAAPAGVSFGTYTVKGFNSGGALTVWDKSKYIGSIHYTGDVALPNIQCKHCHEKHGSSINGYTGATPVQTTRDLLKAQYIRLEGANYYPWANPAGTGFNLCFGCHTGSDGNGGLRDVKNDAWAGEHGSHDDDGPCIYCHDVHAPYDVTPTYEFGLHSFEYNRMYSDLTYETGYNASTAFDRTRNPPCGIACHGVSHLAKKYTAPPDYDTTPGNVYPFGFAVPASTTYTLQTATDPLVGTVNNPAVALQNGYFNGNGVDTYINFTSNPDAALATSALVVETRLMPQGIPTAVASAPSTKGFAGLFNNTLSFSYWISALLPQASSADNKEAVIFDRGVDANYRLSLLRNADWRNYKAPLGVASFAFWVNPTDKHGGQDWKVAVTNYEKCPIVSDHWYSVRVQWDSGKPEKEPIDIFVDDQGSAGDDEGEMWQGLKNCTDWHPVKALVPFDLQSWSKDSINAMPGDFTIGASVGAFSNPFQGLIESITIYPEDAARNLLLKWRSFPFNGP